MFGDYETFGDGKVKVVVRAKDSGHTIAENPSEYHDYSFQAGEMGVMMWQSSDCCERITSWEPFVIWDNDPDKRPRMIFVDDVEIVGIETPKRHIPGRGFWQNLLMPKTRT